MENGRTRYPDIFDRPRHVSATRQPMSAMERAAQFAPFAALKGFDEEIDRTTEAEMADDA